MFWNDDNQRKHTFEVPDSVLDINYKIKCSHLPLDHAYALSEVITQKFPWVKSHDLAGMHLIHGAESGNGWIRPTDPKELIYPSRRTLFTLRVPKEHVEEAKTLVGQSLSLLDTQIEFTQASERPLYKLTTIFSRYIISAADEEENTFLENAHKALEIMNIRPQKMMCGRSVILSFPDRDITTRSLMIDGIEPQESVRLQQEGLGIGRHFGCGLFLPHKGIDAVGDTQEK
jgi:CRISPR-associated protein Cas6